MIHRIRSMSQGRWLVLVVAPLVLVGLVAGGIAFAAGESIPRSALTGGSGGLLTGTNIRLQNAIAQPVAGTVKNQLTLCSGLFCAQGVQPSCSVPLTGLNISGPGSVAVNQLTPYTAVTSPLSPTLPIGYIWSPAPSLGQGTATATYGFTVTAETVISVRADNCGGTFSADMNIIVGGSSSSGNYFSPAVFIDIAGFQ